MGTGETILLVTALLAAPCGVLIGAAAGAWSVWRVMNNKPPVPSLRRPAVAAPPPKNDEPPPGRPLPRVRA